MQGILEGKIAVITGAGSGLGRAAAKLWTEQGANVIAADIDLAAAEETVTLLGLPPERIKATHCDVADPASVDAAVALAAATFGRLDIMYNNAGITVNPTPGAGLPKFVDLPLNEMRRVEDVNLHGVVYGSQAAIRQFDKQQSGGVIINTASVAGLTGYGGVFYGATKGAVVALTRTLAIELAEKNIRVNSVCPAGMITHYGGGTPDGPGRARAEASMGKAHPLGRPIEPADTAAAAMFLASDFASNITGVNLPVDGGLTAGRKAGGG